MTPGRNQHLTAMIITTGSFIVLVVLVWTGKTILFDRALRNWAISFNTPTTVAAWECISQMGSVIVISSLTFLSMGIFAIRRNWPAFQQLAFAMGGAIGLNTVIKLAIHRLRPVEVYAHTMPASYSFPSGHALYSLTFYISIAIIMSRHNRAYPIKIICSAALVIVALIGSSRIFLGVHYGTDVLGGYLIAIIWLMFIKMQTEKSMPQSAS